MVFWSVCQSFNLSVLWAQHSFLPIFSDIRKTDADWMNVTLIDLRWWLSNNSGDDTVKIDKYWHESMVTHDLKFLWQRQNSKNLIIKERQKKDFASFCIVSHGLFQGQKGINIEKWVPDPFYGSFGRSIGLLTSWIF